MNNVDKVMASADEAVADIPERADASFHPHAGDLLACSAR